VILGGGIDLSVPWVMTGSATMTAALTNGSNGSLGWVMPVVLGIAVLVGTANGVGVAILGVSPIVMTLATNVVISGVVPLEFQLGAGVVAPHGITNLAFGSLLGLPAPLFILLGATAAMTVVLAVTPFGRRVYAVGANATASRLSGVNTRAVTIFTYVISALGAALGGLVLLGFVGRAYAGMADAYQFSTIAVVVVGGASILGGSGNYLGTVAGVLLLTVLNSLLQVYSLSAGLIEILYGVIILVSVWLAQQHVGGRFRLTDREARQDVTEVAVPEPTGVTTE
jgi:ribose transport system permease protein